MGAVNLEMFYQLMIFQDRACDSNLQYGAWLHPSPLKTHRRNTESQLLEERKPSMAFKNKAT